MRQLEVVVYELTAAYERLGEDRATEHRARADLWSTYSADLPVAARERDIDAQTSDLRAQVFIDEAAVKSLEAERDYLMWTVEHAHADD